jgi:SEC-C motif-containing protein
MPAAEPPRHVPTRCPCLSGLPYDECCGPLHRHDAVAPTAEQLMRSRYSAFAVGDADYLLTTWHPSTRPASLELDPDLRWYRLDIVAVRGGGNRDSEGVVEFEAHYRSPGGPGSQHETSRFAKERRRWYYLTGA